MARPSKIDLLPAGVRDELNRRLVANAFSGYEALADWLATQGCELKKSAVHAYGQRLERRLSAIKASTEAAAAIAAAAPDEADQRSAAVISLVQTDIFDIMVTLQEAEEGEPADRLKLLSRAAKSIAELSRASVNQKKWQAEVSSKVKAAEAKAGKIAAQAGVSAAQSEAIRAAIREIVG